MAATSLSFDSLGIGCKPSYIGGCSTYMTTEHLPVDCHKTAFHFCIVDSLGGFHLQSSHQLVLCLLSDQSHSSPVL